MINIDLIDKALALIIDAIVPTNEIAESFPLAAEERLERGLAYVQGRLSGVRQAFYRDHKYTKTG